MMLGRPARIALGSVLALSVVTLLASARAFVSARSELAAARQSVRGGDLEAAIVHYRRAARWDAPFNPFAADAFAELLRIAEHAELQRRPELALTAYRAFHAAKHATRGLWTRDDARLSRADQRIAALMAAMPPPQMEAEIAAAEREAAYLALLEKSGPDPFGVLLALGGFVTWVSALAVLLLGGLDREGRVIRRIARPSFVCLLFGWVAFAVGLRIA